MINTENPLILSIMEEITKFAKKYSDDPHTQTGCHLILKEGIIIPGTNRMPNGVFKHDHRKERPEKYAWIEHAERDAIYQAARMGKSTEGATMVLNWFPCVECARAIASAGIRELVCVEPQWENETYQFKKALSILLEARQNIIISYVRMKS